MLFFKDISIHKSPSVIQVDQEALGYPQRPRQAQPWGVQQVQPKYVKNLSGACLYTIFQR